MNFNLKAAGTLLSRAKQFTEEKLGQATDRTEFDENFEQLLNRADRTRQWTERLTSHVETVLQPNPNERLEDFILTKLDQKTTNKSNIIEQLGQCMFEAGNDFGPSTQYGSALLKCGTAHQKLGLAYKEFIQSSAVGFMQPLKSFLDGEMRTITKERRTLELKRLDLDAARSKKKKSKMINNQNQTPAAMADNLDTELRHAQTEFDRQLEMTRLLLDGLNHSHNHHLRCLNDLVESELQYHRQAVQILEELRKQLGLVKLNSSSSTVTPAPRSPRTATVKFDYDASDSNELSVLAKEIVNIVMEDNDRNTLETADWITIEKLDTKERGRIPRAYLRLDQNSTHPDA